MAFRAQSSLINFQARVNGLFAENCIVIAEGQYEEGIFVVHTLGFPPPENREQSL